MKDDLRKIEVGGVSSHDLYVKREYRHHAEAHCVLGQTTFISSYLEIGPAKWRQLLPTWGMFVLARSGVHPRVTSGRYVKVLPDRKHKDYRNVYTQCMYEWPSSIKVHVHSFDLGVCTSVWPISCILYAA